MDDLETMCCVESTRDLFNQVCGAARIDRAFFLDHVAQRAAVHILHREIHGAAGGLAEVVHTGNVFVVNTARVRRFAIEARDGCGISHHLWPQHFDRGLLWQANVPREIDLAHAAFAEEVGDEIPIRNDAADQPTIEVNDVQRRSVDRAERIRVGIDGVTDWTDFRHQC